MPSLPLVSETLTHPGFSVEGGGTTVELPTLNTSAERLAVLGGLPPVVPPEIIPNLLLRLLNIERVNLKLKPPQ